MSVHQTTDGRWFVKYQKGRNPDDPTRTREYFGRGPEGEIRARDRNKQLGLGQQAVVGTPTFAELTTAYLSAHPALSRASAISLKAKLKSVIMPFFGNLQAVQISPEVIDRFVSYRLKRVKKTTIHRDLSDLRAILRWSVNRRYISANPMEGYKLPTRDDAVIRPPSKAEVQAIIKVAPPHLKRAIIISYYTGLRPGEVELLRMTWSQVDLAGQSIEVMSADKGGLPQRYIPIEDEQFAALLKRWLAEDIEDFKKKNESSREKKNDIGNRCVITWNGKPIRSLKTAWKSAKAGASITRRIRMYDLRHAFATQLLAADADLKTVSEMLGHKSIQQTADTYQHVITSLRKKTIKKLPPIIDES